MVGGPQCSPISPVLSIIYIYPLLLKMHQWNNSSLSMYVDNGLIFACAASYDSVSHRLRSAYRPYNRVRRMAHAIGTWYRARKSRAHLFRLSPLTSCTPNSHIIELMLTASAIWASTSISNSSGSNTFPLLSTVSSPLSSHSNSSDTQSEVSTLPGGAWPYASRYSLTMYNSGTRAK
jgi:hypothetical protein